MTPYIPHRPTPKQAAFLLLPHLEALYGGAAGGGKSDALLMAALQYVDVPLYSAILIRKTYSDLALSGALMSRAYEWLNGKAHWTEDTKTWEFPSGATLSFGYLDNPRAHFRYQSAEFQFIGFDELTQFEESQYLYMFSRLRRGMAQGVPLRMRAASNPGNIGHEWVKRRFIQEGAANGRPFISARLDDNPHLDRDSYRRSLGMLDQVTRAQLESGNWDVTLEGGVARREWFPVVAAPPADVFKRVRAWDFAATEKSAKSPDPDWTVGTLMSVTRGERPIYTVEHVIRVRAGAGKVERLVIDTAADDGRGVSVRLEQEPGSSGVMLVSSLVSKLPGYIARGSPTTGDKITRGLPFVAQAEAGNVRIVRGLWNREWLDEIVSQPHGSHDDQWDSAAHAFSELVSAGVWFV